MMRVLDGILWILVIAGLAVSFYSNAFAKVFGGMILYGFIASLFLFFAVLGITYFGGAETFNFPGFKQIFTFFFALAFISGAGLVAGNEAANYISGNAVSVSSAVFSRDFLNAAMVLVVGIAALVYVLVLKPKL